MRPTKIRFIWRSGFSGEDFQKSTNQKEEYPVAAMFINGSGGNEQSLWRTFHTCFLLRLGALGQAVSEENIVQKSANQKQELPVAALFVTGSRRNEQSLKRILHRCFGSFSNAVSGEKILTPSDVNSSHCLWQGELKRGSTEDYTKQKQEVLLQLNMNINKRVYCSKTEHTHTHKVKLKINKRLYCSENEYK